MNNQNLDVSVLIVFFNRPKSLKRVFDQVKKAKPRKLFLYQDGAREDKPTDFELMLDCRKIVQDVDWECEVLTNYQDKNVGCDPSGYNAHKWAFSIVDKCIVLEDDCVPTISFFEYCKILLDKYEIDNRVQMICGMNSLGTYNLPSGQSYFLSTNGSMWGWASWKRVIDSWDKEYSILNDDKEIERIKKDSCVKDYINISIETAIRHKNSGIAHFETINELSMLKHNRLNIVPCRNMIINIGNSSEGGTHSASDLRLIPKGLRKIFELESYEVEIPLTHPESMIEDVGFSKKICKLMGWGYPLKNFLRKIEAFLLKIRYGEFYLIFKALKRRFPF